MATGDGLNRVLVALDRLGCQPHQRAGKTEFFCPVHGDGKNRSAAVWQGDKGAVINCAAGCSKDDLLGQIGVQFSELFDEKLPSKKLDWDHPNSRWDYHNADGAYIFSVLRWDTEDGKQMRQGVQIGGRWRYSLTGVTERPLYRLPSVLAAAAKGEWVFVVEGERCADAMAAAGKCATTSPMGAGKWTTEHAKALVGAKVLVLVDKDEPGYKHGADVWESLVALGTTPEGVVAGCECELGCGHDVADWIAWGKDLDAMANWSPLATPATSPAVAVREDDCIVSEPVLGQAAFRGPLGEVALAFENYTEAQPAAVLASLLVGVGTSINRSAHALVGADQHVTSLYVMMVGPSAAGAKGTASRLAWKALKGADPVIMNGRCAGGFGSGEAFVDKVGEGDDHRLIFYDEEFGRTLAIASRRGDTLSAQLRQAYDGGTLAARARKETTVTKAGSYHVGVLGHITPADLVAVDPADLDNGWGNRFLWCWVRRRAVLADPPIIGESLWQWAHDSLRVALDRGRSGHRFVRTDRARALWGEIQAELCPEREDLVGGLLARARANVLRLSVLYAAVAGARSIDVEHLESALAVWRWSAQTAEFLWGDGARVEGARKHAIERSGGGLPSARLSMNAAKMFQALEDKEELTGRERSAVFGRNLNAVELAEVIRELEKLKLAKLVSRTSQRGGPVSQVLVQW